MALFDKSQLSSGLKILSFDGGGIRGYSSLLIINEVMISLKQQLQLDVVPKPHEVFDIIGGTSTGGIISILIGRLELSAEEALEAYARVAQQAFVPKSALKITQGRYSATKLTEAICSELERSGVNRDALFVQPAGPKTVVLATTKVNVDALPTLFRTYDTNSGNRQCKIWEVARATSAATTYFKPIKCGSHGIEYLDSGFGHNNPCDMLIAEAQKTSPERKIACIISVGTGLGRAIEVDNAISILKALPKMATSSRNVHISMQQSIHKDCYWRFDEDIAISEIKMDEWKKLENVAAHTSNYLNNPSTKKSIDACVAALKALSGELSASTQSVPALHFELNNYARNPDFLVQELALNHLESVFGERNRNFESAHPMVRRTVIRGMGGIGKTQLAIEYAFMVRSKKSVFWINADTTEVFDQRLKELAAKHCYHNASAGERTRGRDRRTVFLQWLQELRHEWLLIIDNVEHLKDLNRIHTFFPSEGLGDILITTRQHTVVAAVGGSYYSLQSLSKEDAAVVFLCRLLRGKSLSVASVQSFVNHLLIESTRDVAELEDLDTDQSGISSRHRVSSALLVHFQITSMSQIEKILDLFDGLPLGLVQSAAYMAIPHHEQTIEDYLKRLQQTSEKHFFEFMGKSARNDVEYSLNKVWRSSYEHVKQALPHAAKLLDFFGFLNRRTITVPFLSMALEDRMFWNGKLVLSLPKKTREEFVDYLPYRSRHSNLEEMLRELSNLSLITYDIRGQTIDIHTLVHRWLTIKMSNDEVMGSLIRTMRLLQHHLPPTLYPEGDQHIVAGSLDITLTHAVELYRPVLNCLEAVTPPQALICSPEFAEFFLCLYRWTWNKEYLEIASSLWKAMAPETQSKYLIVSIKVALLYHDLGGLQAKLEDSKNLEIFKQRLQQLDTIELYSAGTQPSAKLWTTMASIFAGFSSVLPQFSVQTQDHASRAGTAQIDTINQPQSNSHSKELIHFSQYASKIISKVAVEIIQVDPVEQSIMIDVSKAVMLTTAHDFPGLVSTFPIMRTVFSNALKASSWGLKELAGYFPIYIQTMNTTIQRGYVHGFDLGIGLQHLKEVRDGGDIHKLLHRVDLPRLLLNYGSDNTTKKYWEELMNITTGFSLKQSFEPFLPFCGDHEIDERYASKAPSFVELVQNSMLDCLGSKIQQFGPASAEVLDCVMDMLWFADLFRSEYDGAITCIKIIDAYKANWAAGVDYPQLESARDPIQHILEFFPSIHRPDQQIAMHEKGFSLACRLPRGMLVHATQAIARERLKLYTSEGSLERVDALNKEVQEQLEICQRDDANDHKIWQNFRWLWNEKVLNSRAAIVSTEQMRKSIDQPKQTARPSLTLHRISNINGTKSHSPSPPPAVVRPLTHSHSTPNFWQRMRITKK